LITETKTPFEGETFKLTVAKEMITDVPYHGISLGLSRYPEDGSTSDVLIKLADQAMYVEKRLKRKAR